MQQIFYVQYIIVSHKHLNKMLLCQGRGKEFWITFIRFSMFTFFIHLNAAGEFVCFLKGVFFSVCVHVFSRSYIDMLQRVKELCRYLPGLEGDTRSRCCSQVVICAALVLFRSAFLYVSAVQPALFQGTLLSLPSSFTSLPCYQVHFSSSGLHIGCFQ